MAMGPADNELATAVPKTNSFLIRAQSSFGAHNEESSLLEFPVKANRPPAVPTAITEYYAYSARACIFWGITVKMKLIMASHFERFDSYIPLNLLTWENFLVACLVLYGFVIFRLVLMIGAFNFIYYSRYFKFFGQRQIYPEIPSWQDMKHEVKWSLITSSIFAVSGVVIGILWQMNWAQLYLDFSEYGWWYLPASWCLYLVVHDTYFYWLHRLLHWPPLYRRVHQVHHLSLRPTPWASFSFHPSEALLEAAILPLLVLVIPIHPTVLLFHLTFMTLTAISNHSGFEVLPRSWPWLGQWFISGLHHSQHHSQFNRNYGLFFTFWDRLCGTQHPKFDQQWELT